MSLELIYTSAAKGLKPGSRGFCTVAMTQGMPPQLVDRLEALSGYRQVFAPQDPQAGLNPVVCSHLRISVAGRNYHVLSRVCAAGLDYSQRTNKFAHHVVLDANELPPAGPAWLLAMPGFMTTAWDQTTRLLPPRPRPPAGNSAPAVCQRWQQATGDAGWGGVLIDAAIKNPRSMATLIFRPGQDPLPLLAESLALLPVELRWQATFSTYYTRLPPGVECRWRCVVEGSPEAKTAAGLVINLCHRLAQPPAGEYVTAARTGRVPTAKGPPRLIPADAPDDSELANLLGDPIAPPESAAAHAPIEPTDWPGSLQLPPSLPAGISADSGSTLGRRRFREKESAQWPYVVGLLAVALVMVVGGIAAWNAVSGGTAPAAKRTVATNDGNGRQTVVQPSPAQGPRAVGAAQKPDERAADERTATEKQKEVADAEMKKAEEARKAQEIADRNANQQRVAQQEAADKAVSDERKKLAEKNAAKEKLIAAATEAINGIAGGLVLPDVGSTAPVPIATLKIPDGTHCQIKFFGSDTLPRGMSLTASPPTDRPSGEVKVSLTVPHAVPPEIPLAAFNATDKGVQFQWESGARNSRDKAGQIRNSALRITISGDDAPVRSRLFSLRQPVVGPPPAEFGKIVSMESGVVFECKNIDAPPADGTALYVEFFGKRGPIPIRSESNPKLFEIDGKLQFDVRTVLNGSTITMRVKYLGVLVPWELPDGAPLKMQLQAPNVPTRMTAEKVVKFIDYFKKDRLESINTELKKKQKEYDDAANDKDKGKRQELAKSVTEIKNEKKDCEDEIADAQSIQDSLAGIEKETCGYRVCFVVRCGNEQHKVCLVTADPESGNTTGQQ